jgi:hypothetical protein
MILRLQKLKKVRIGGLYREQMQKNENHVALKPGTPLSPPPHSARSLLLPCVVD